MYSRKYRGEQDITGFSKQMQVPSPIAAMWRAPVVRYMAGVLEEIDHIYRLFAGIRPEPQQSGIVAGASGRISIPICTFSMISEQLVPGKATAVTHAGFSSHSVTEEGNQRDYHAVWDALTVRHVAGMIELEGTTTGVTRKFHVDCIPTAGLGIAAGERIGMDIAFQTADNVDQGKLMVAVLRFPKEQHHTIKPEITDEIPSAYMVYLSTDAVLDAGLLADYSGAGLRAYISLTCYA